MSTTPPTTRRRYCFSSSGKIFVPEDCDPSCDTSKQADCSQCRCRGCQACACADMQGSLLPSAVCPQAYPNEYRDINFGLLPSSEWCAHECSSYLPGAAENASGPCVAWSFAAGSASLAESRGHCIGHASAPHFRSRWEPPGLTTGVATCAAPAGGPGTALAWQQQERNSLPQPHGTQLTKIDSTHASVILLFTIGSFACSSAAIARLARAQAQVRRQSKPISAFRVLQMSRSDDHGNFAAEDAAASKALATSLGEGVVELIGPKQVKSAFRSLQSEMRRIHWFEKRRPAWLANGCDLPALVWFALFGSRVVPARAHVWVLQHDVGWTGDLPLVLASVASAIDQGGEADLICKFFEAGPGWVHFREQTYLRDDDVRACLLPVTRYSTRLLRELVALVAAGNRTAYCEMRAATHCHQSSWCRSGHLRTAAHALGPFSAFTAIDESYLDHSSLSACPHGRSGRLFHRVAHVDRDFHIS